MFRSTRLISVLLCNTPEDDGDWWMDKHQVTHFKVTVHMPLEALLLYSVDCFGSVKVGDHESVI